MLPREIRGFGAAWFYAKRRVNWWEQILIGERCTHEHYNATGLTEDTGVG